MRVGTRFDLLHHLPSQHRGERVLMSLTNLGPFLPPRRSTRFLTSKKPRSDAEKRVDISTTDGRKEAQDNI